MCKFFILFVCYNILKHITRVLIMTYYHTMSCILSILIVIFKKSGPTHNLKPSQIPTIANYAI